MSKKEKNPFADSEMLKAYHIERRELESAENVQVVTSITTACRPDRVVIRMEAIELSTAYNGRVPLCSTTREWPNEVSMSFSACLFRTCVSLTRLVQDSHADLWRSTLRAQDGG